MNAATNPEIAALREQIEGQNKELIAQAKELSEMRGNIQQLDKIVGATTRQSIWQLIILVVSLCGSIVGGLVYQTTMIDKRIEQLEKRIELSEKNMSGRFEDLKDQIEKRIELSEKNMTGRFEDLKQEVRAQRK